MAQDSEVRFFENNLLYDVPFTSALSLFRCWTNAPTIEYWGRSLYFFGADWEMVKFFSYSGNSKFLPVRGQESPADKFKWMFLSAPQWVLPFPFHINPLPLCFPLWHEGDTAVQLCRARAQLSPGAGLALQTQHLHTLGDAVRNQYQAMLACSLVMEK